MTIKTSAITLEEALKDMPKDASEYFNIPEDVNAWVFTDGTDRYAIWRQGKYATYMDFDGEHPVTEEKILEYKAEAEEAAKLFDLTFTGETVVLPSGSKFRIDNIQDTGASVMEVMLGLADFYAYAMKL